MILMELYLKLMITIYKKDLVLLVKILDGQ